MRLWLAYIVAAMAAAPAVAGTGWYKASSPHFVIYSQEEPEKLQAYAEKLERFDQAVRQIRKWDDPALGDGNRLTVYVLDNVAAVQKAYGRTGDVYGFFRPGFTGPIAFTPQSADRYEWGLTADAVFYHEYGHHLMFQQFSIPMPNWFVEGFAELVSGTRLEKDGSITIGLAPKHRAFALFSPDGLTSREVLAQQPKKLSSTARDSIYARGWLLTHYLLFEPARNNQLTSYFTLLKDGKAMDVAATEAFGDLRVFDRELERYLRRPRLLAVTVAATSLKIGKINVEPLSAGANEALPWQMLSKRGVNEKSAPQVAEKLRAIAARYPKDPFVQGALAEAEYDVKRFDLSLVAANAALAANPRDIQALTYKGRSLIELAAKGERSATFAEARNALLAANKIDPEDPEPLFLFYQSFLRAGQTPTSNAIAALHYASVLAPADEQVRMTSAVQRMTDKQYAAAKSALLPVAYNPHGGEFADKVREALDLLNAGKGEDALTYILTMQQEAEQPEGEPGKDKPKPEK